MQVLPNIDYIKQLAGDDLEFQQQFISILKTEFPLEHKEYLDHVQNGHYKEAALIVHKIKHKFNILGLEEPYHLAQKYEADLKARNTDKEKEFEKILDLVGAYIAQL